MFTRLLSFVSLREQLTFTQIYIRHRFDYAPPLCYLLETLKNRIDLRIVCRRKNLSSLFKRVSSENNGTIFNCSAINAVLNSVGNSDNNGN